jgi:glycosyltransferase involved in cell wall biosynthesis
MLPVLYYNHTGLVSGAEVSLLALLEAARAVGRPLALACPMPPSAHAAAPVDGLAAGAELPGDRLPGAGTPAALAARARALGVPVLPVPAFTPGFPRTPAHLLIALRQSIPAARGLARAVRAQQAAIVHANSVRAGLIAALTPLPAHTRLVVHVRDALPPTVPGRLVAALLARRAHAVIAISRFVAAAFTGQVADATAGPAPGVHRPGGGLLQPSMLRVIYNGVDPSRWDPARADGARVRQELGVPPQAPLLALVGQITPWKGQRDALCALPTVRARYPTAVLLVAGSPKFTGPTVRADNLAYAAELRRTAAALGLDGGVRFLGERDDVPDLLAAADLLVLPSWAEPFGRVLIEAMAMARPVVATRAGGVPEVVEHGASGLLVPPRAPAALAAAILALLDDPARARAMGARGRAVVTARFTAAQTAAAIDALYAELGAAGPSPTPAPSRRRQEAWDDACAD